MVGGGSSESGFVVSSRVVVVFVEVVDDCRGVSLGVDDFSNPGDVVDSFHQGVSVVVVVVDSFHHGASVVVDSCHHGFVIMTLSSGGVTGSVVVIMSSSSSGGVMYSVVVITSSSS